jgi:integral membrane sensor domain MASE1
LRSDRPDDILGRVVSVLAKAGRMASWAALFGVAYVATAHINGNPVFLQSYIGLVWVPNALLVSALILTSRKSWWLVLAVSAVAHVVAMHGTTPVWRMAWQIPANAVFAMAITEALRRTIGFPLRFERSRDVLVYAALAAVFPALLALIAPAFVLAFAGVETTFSPPIAFARVALANIAPLVLVTPAVVLCARLGRRHASVVWRQPGVEAAIVIDPPSPRVSSRSMPAPSSAASRGCSC